MIAAKKGGDKTTPAVPSFKPRNYCEEDHQGDGSIWDRIEQRTSAAEMQ